MKCVRGLSVLLPIVATLGLPSIGRAVDSARPDPRPLLLVHITNALSYAGCSGGVPAPNSASEQSVFINRGGVLQDLRVTGTPGQAEPYRAACLEGAAVATELGALNRALGLAQVGSLGDCELHRRTDPNCFDEVGAYQLAWYGRTDRVNAFAVKLVPGQPSPSVVCPASVEDLLDALARFRETVVASRVGCPQ